MASSWDRSSAGHHGKRDHHTRDRPLRAIGHCEDERTSQAGAAGPGLAVAVDDAQVVWGGRWSRGVAACRGQEAGHRPGHARGVAEQGQLHVGLSVAEDLDAESAAETVALFDQQHRVDLAGAAWSGPVSISTSFVPAAVNRTSCVPGSRSTYPGESSDEPTPYTNGVT